MTLTDRIAKAIEAEAERQFHANPNAIETYNYIVNDDGTLRLDLYGRYDLSAMCAAIEAVIEVPNP